MADVLFIVDVILILQISQFKTVNGTGNWSQKCSSSDVLIDGKCYSSCPDHLPLNITLDSGKIPSDMQPRYTCVSRCPQNLLRANNSCVKTCSTGQFDFNNSCVKHCPSLYCQIDYLSQTDCIKRIHFACSKKCEDGDTMVTNACLYNGVGRRRCHEFCTGDSESVTLCKKMIQSNDSRLKSDWMASVSYINWKTGQVLRDGHQCYPICYGEDNFLLNECQIWRNQRDMDINIFFCKVFTYKGSCVDKCPLLTYAEFKGDECRSSFVFLFLSIICAVLLLVTTLAIISIYCGDYIYTCNQSKEDSGQVQGLIHTEVS